jgi:o-succinylbenzoate synthase
MIRASYTTRPLVFKHPAGTSRGVLHEKMSWYIQLTEKEGGHGLGEVSFIPGLSVEDPHEMEIQLDHICKLVNRGEMNPLQALPAFPGIQFALETAWKDLAGGGNRLLYPSEFTKGRTGIGTNGLIWMGDQAYMNRQISEKMKQGFRVLKLKVGALELDQELEVLKGIRSEYGWRDLEIRLDANGAWNPLQAPGHIQKFAEYDIHSIEQPIARGQAESMARLCASSPIPVALDEELIGIFSMGEKAAMLEAIKPSYIILKPGLLGGFSITEEWINMAESKEIGWWVTSALESSIGLNAIAQWTYNLKVSMPQGLGVGTLYTNNIASPLTMLGKELWHLPETGWDLQSLPTF